MGENLPFSADVTSQNEEKKVWHFVCSAIHTVTKFSDNTR